MRSAPTTPKGASLLPIKSILKTPVSMSPKSANGVHFEPPDDLERTLEAAANDALGREELDGFITHMKNQQGAALVDWLQRIQNNLSLLKPSLESFVLAILNISWADQERPVVSAYKHFLANLVSAQNYYMKPVVKMLLMTMMGSKDAAPSDDQSLVFENAHEALRFVVHISPLAATTSILSYAKSSMPFMMTPMTHMHTNFIANLLKITEYLPAERIPILTLVVDRLVQLDAHLPHGEDLYEDDDDDNDDGGNDENGKRSRQDICRDNLDMAMKVMFEFITEDLYPDLLKVFESNILPSYATGHVQYLMFYAVSLKPDIYGPQWVDWFWRLFTCPSTPSILRQSAIAYIASFIARSKCMDVAILRLYLRKITAWIHGYLSARSDPGNDYNCVDVRAHGAFYAACQAALYMLAFRHEELIQGPKSLDFLSKLGLGRIVTCSLNPLKVCLPPVVKNFAAIARHYQLAYCETVIQRNNRLDLPVVGVMSSNTSVVGIAKPALLDTFFPFDPYRLQESKSFISGMYREYHGSLADVSSSSEDDSDDEESEDEALEPETKRRRLNSSGSLLDFDYETHPGFLKVDH